MKKRIAIFISGKGTNARVIIDNFKERNDVEVVVVISNNPNSILLPFAKEEGIDVQIVTNQDLNNKEKMLELLARYNLSLICLAGFMRKIQPFIVEQYRDRILNIHPAIDRKYDGMTGDQIHLLVLKNGDKFHGSRVHFVTEEYDKGETADFSRFEVDHDISVEELTEEILKR